LSRKTSHLKTVFLDMDETLIHCDENSNQYTVKLNFPLERGGTLAVLLLLDRQG
jgi:predicted HAD superfamily phosphohydrolase YqeG